VDVSAGYRVGPEGTAAPLPAPAPPPSDLAARARRALVALAALLLLGDVLWFAVIRRRGKR
jgi:hypothetical protein